MEAPNLDLLKAGDQATWDSAFQWLWPTAFAVARNKLFKSPDEVQDIAIESITKLIRHVSKVGRVEELKAILAKITHDECVGYIRSNTALKRGEGNILSLDELLEQTGDHFVGSTVSEDFGNRDLVRLIMNLAEGLKPKEKLVFEEFHLHGLNYGDISSKHGIPQGSIGVYLKRAIETLRGLLAGKGETFL